MIKYFDKDTAERLSIATGEVDPSTNHLKTIPTGTVELRYFCDYLDCGVEIEGPEYLHRFSVPHVVPGRHLCSLHRDMIMEKIW